jgi:hypothetical protein
MNSAPTTYAIRVAGHLDDHWSAWFGALDMTRDDDGTTTVVVSVDDQARLHGVLAGLRDIGAVLTEVRATGTPFPIRWPGLERPLHTERLILRPATAGSASKVGRLAGSRTLFSEPAGPANAVMVTLGHDDAGGVVGAFMLQRGDARADPDVAGQARGAQAELGWVLDPAHGGHGHAVEAVRELLRYCFEELGVRRVAASCFLDDDTSWRLMERAGMRRELHTVRGALHRSGRWLDTVGYAILDEEWSPT